MKLTPQSGCTKCGTATHDNSSCPMKPMPEAKQPPEYGTRLLISDDWEDVHDVGEYEAETGAKTDESHHWMRVSEHTHLLSEAVAKTVREAKAEVWDEVADKLGNHGQGVRLSAKWASKKAAELRENGGKNE